MITTTRAHSHKCDVCERSFDCDIADCDLFRDVCDDCVSAAPTPKAATVTAMLPKRFYDDHVARDLDAGALIAEHRKQYEVSLDLAAFDELLSDAEYYADPSFYHELRQSMGRDALNLVTSARHTVTALRKIETPWSAR